MSEVVLVSMLALPHLHQVLGTVITRVVIDVVNDFAR